MTDPTIDNPIISIQQVMGWGVLYLMLIAAADIPATGQLSAAFAWLLFVSILLMFGVDALNGLANLTSGGNSNRHTGTNDDKVNNFIQDASIKPRW